LISKFGGRQSCGAFLEGSVGFLDCRNNQLNEEELIKCDESGFAPKRTNLRWGGADVWKRNEWKKLRVVEARMNDDTGSKVKFWK
jgi:hypothetical protein